MNTFLLIFTAALFAALVLTPLLRRICERRDWLDVPRDERRVHVQPVPRLGGVAIIISIFIALSLLSLLNNLVTQTVWSRWPQLLMVLIPATLVLLFGVYDDFYGTSASLKFSALGTAGVLFYALGGRVEALSIPLLGSVQLSPAAGFAVTVIWVVAITNAFNLIDGMDGLATGAALFASVVLLVVSLMLDQVLVTVVALALTGSLIGFLRYNFNPASIFLGDSGSLLIGFMLAALSVQGTLKAPTAVAVAIPLLACGLPVVDTTFTIIRRFVGGRPLFQGDREHIHHKLLERGWSQRRVAIVLYTVSALFGLLALLFASSNGRATGLALFVVGAAVVIAAGNLRYHEVDEIKAGMKRNLGERRQRVSNNVRLRKASRLMSKADTLDKLFAAVREMLELGEFVYAYVQLGDSANTEGSARAYAHEAAALNLCGAHLQSGWICWSWKRGDVEPDHVLGSSHYWTLRLPLSTGQSAWGYINLYRAFESDALLLDVNYLCALFQREMSHAAERIFAAGKVDQQQSGSSNSSSSSVLALSAAGQK